MIKVKQEVRIYEENDREIPLGQVRYLNVESHWNRDEMVVLIIGKEHMTVLGNDLETAIHNAMNINRF